MIHPLDLRFLGHDHTIASFLISTAEGPILIESGPHSTLPALEQALAQHHVQLADIQHVLLTHIHLDHAGAAWALAQHGATVWVHPVGLPHLADPSRLMQSAQRIYGDDMDRLWGEMRAIPEAQLHAVADNALLRFGEVELRAHYTPGHASHHIAWQYDDVVLTGDVAGVRIANGPVVPPCPPPDIDIEHWRDSIRCLRELAPRQLYLTHFGRIDDPLAHLDELETRLIDWAAWMRIPWEAGRTAAEVVPEFQAYVRQQLRDQGVTDEEVLAQYEAANPSWMSVEGLFRYWRKYQPKTEVN
ncbi:Glyoxylase, beta-lactamase superfamily II [Catalinimonas alkaloidigena]|uniref:Glyoxylase, beta-lactamase superfamily II n=1 Tax=Catalinimonas alkaloidigena TaxID=1075417 RepID=A0A1G9QA29_9BACT|nr:MBL fold metallo-hydrolase [Catalinimonas alkaloidigena]SDM07942.1 Glyoxylase, beta-lactamase superfamily II [Catalinimonas alkaloidigena]